MFNLILGLFLDSHPELIPLMQPAMINNHTPHYKTFLICSEWESESDYILGRAGYLT